MKMKKNNEKDSYCHYSDLPSPMAYVQKKEEKNIKNMNKWSNYGKWRHPEKRKELIKNMNKTIYYSILHLLAGITLGYILFSCDTEYKSNVITQEHIDYTYTIDSLQIKLDGKVVELQQCNEYVKFLESDNMMLRKGIMLEYEDLNK